MTKDLLAQDEFAPVDHDTWRKAIGKQSDVAKTDDGIEIVPLALRRSDVAALIRARTQPHWRLTQRIDDPDPVRAAEQARREVEAGADGLTVVFEGAPNAFGYGLPATADSLKTVFDGLDVNGLHLRIDPHPKSRMSADWMLELLQAKKVDPAQITVAFGIDPAAVLAGTGRLRMTVEAMRASLPQSLAGFFAMSVPGVLLEADGRIYHNAGASEAQELGAILSSAVSHLKMFDQARQPILYGAPLIGFSLSLDQNIFVNIAKVRALRLLWQRVLESCELEPLPARIHGESSMRMMSARDPDSNVLRTSIAAFAGAAGGVDSLSVLPHSQPQGLPNGKARALSRSGQHLMIHESRLGHVFDPAAGSGAIETLTDGLCQAAWDEFQKLEREGGILDSLLQGAFQARVTAKRAQRQAEFMDGKHVIVGANKFEHTRTGVAETYSADKMSLPTDGALFCQRMDASLIEDEMKTP